MNKNNKNDLINIIENIIIDEGILNLNIRNVANKANISIGGVQYIFGNKEGMIKAVLNKNEEEYNEEIDKLIKNDNSKEAKVKAHIQYLINLYSSNTENFNKFSILMMAFLQDSMALKEIQEWYRTSLNSLDINTSKGKKLRLAFLLSEGLFILFSFKYIDLDEKEKKEIFDDLKNLLL